MMDWNEQRDKQLEKAKPQDVKCENRKQKLKQPYIEWKEGKQPSETPASKDHQKRDQSKILKSSSQQTKLKKQKNEPYERCRGKNN